MRSGRLAARTRALGCALVFALSAAWVGLLSGQATAAQAERVANGGFEDGMSQEAWTFTTGGGPGGPCSAQLCGVSAASGDWFGVVGPYAGFRAPANTGGVPAGRVSQVVDGPGWPATLQFSYRWTDVDGNGTDTSLDVTVGGSSVVQVVEPEPGSGFTTVTVDLTPEQSGTALASTLAFETMCFNFSSETRTCDRYDIDDVSVIAGSADTDPPQTTITRAPDSVRIAQGKKTAPVTIRFASDEPGSTFECRRDSGEWRACTSPHSVRLTKGDHVLRVRATDAAGNTDPSPAKAAVTVKPPRR